jgi:hypothetical protein
VWLRRRGVHLCLGVMGRVLMLRGGILVKVDMEGMEGGNRAVVIFESYIAFKCI